MMLMYTIFPFAEITGQFLQYLSLLKEFDIDVAVEFMLMSATHSMLNNIA